MRRLVTAAVCGALALAAVGPAAAQEAPAELRLETLDARQHPRVEMVVSVPSSLAGGDLGPEAFTLVENGAPVEATIARIPTEGLDVVLAIDTSGSMSGEPLAQAQSAAAAFVNRLPADVEVAVVGFGAKAEVVAEFGEERSATVAAIEALRSVGETALYDSLITASSAFAREGEAPRRVIVLLSDGGDTVSTVGLDDSILALLGVHADFYAIELLSAESDHEALARLAEATEGAVVPASDPAALAGTFDEIAGLIVNRYALSFNSPSFGATELTIAATTGGAAASLTTTVRYPDAPPPPPPPEPEPPRAVPAPAPAPAPVVIPDPRPGTPVSLGWLGSGTARTAGLVALFIGLAGLATLLLRGGNRARLAAADVRKLLKTRERTKLATFTEHIAQYAERSLKMSGRPSRIEAALEAAGSQLRVGEFVVMAVSVGIVAFAGTYLAGLAPQVAAGAGALGIAASVAVLLHRGRTRQRAFADQLLSTLQLMAGSLRAGFGLLQSIDVVAEEAQSPTADEFYRVKVETQLGRDLDEALAAMSSRVGGDDFEWVVEGIRIHREVGGDLADIIDSVAETVRERGRLRRQVRALSAEGRLSAVVLVLVPVAVALILNITNPDYLSELTGSTVGRIMAAACVALVTAGIFWMRKLIKIEI